MRVKNWVSVSLVAIAPLINAQNTDSGAAAELDAARLAIQAGDYDGALRHTSAVTLAAIEQLKAMPPTSEVVAPPPYFTGPAGPASLLVLVDETKQALAGRDFVRVREYSVTLGIAIYRQIQSMAPTPAETLAHLEQNSIGTTAFERYLLLPDLSTAAYAAGDMNKALSYANELLADASIHVSHWRQGEAIYFGNIIAGRVALARGDLQSAKSHLLAAGLTTGSPRLVSFGPNMALAQELLQHGERNTVTQFLS